MRKELLIAGAIYFVTMFTLSITLYRFLENLQISEFNFFIAGILVILVALGWGYVLSSVIFAPQKQIEDKLTALSENIIHELNIPLATIKANTNMLKKNISDEKALKRIKRIDDASQRLKKLYDELVYSINKEIYPIKKERFNIATLLEERLEVFREQKRNPFHIKLKDYEIEVDKIGFGQICDNLISNAMKYSHKQKPISLSLEEDTLKIQDQGIGMTERELLRVYERYFQVDKNKNGKGLGLSLVKSYCDEQNISIHISSQKGLGTSVSLGLEKVKRI